MFGELIPLGGGDPVPLMKEKLLVGRRESCDIVLRFANVSAHHCELYFDSGYLFVRDLKSRNGVKVNGTKVEEKRVDPDAILSISKHKYRVSYSPVDLGAVGPPPSDTDNMAQSIMGESLLKRAGLDSRRDVRGGRTSGRYDPNNDSAGQIKLPNQAL